MKLLCTAWFFGVMVLHSLDGSWGGWTHDGPHDTKAQCEAARKLTAAHRQETVRCVVTYQPGPCFSDTLKRP